VPNICWHRYAFDADGTIRTARIVPPTAQNQPSIEADLMAVAAPLVLEPDDVIRDRSEHKLRCTRQCLGSRREFDNLGGDFFLPQLTFPLGEADELRFDVRLR
jgi:hypothetical protein